MSSRIRVNAQYGGTLFGVVVGLLLGLVIAAVVAVYVTKSPAPFVDRASRGPDPAVPDPGFAPDPNRALYGRDAAAGLPPSGPVTVAPPPIAEPPASAQRELDDLVASLSKPVPAAPARPSISPERPAEQARDPIPTAPAGRYLLQVGAFRVLEDAEALKAKLTFLGFDVRVQQATVNGMLVNRVQVGPYARLDDMNRARARLAENNVEATVVRQ